MSVAPKYLFGLGAQKAGTTWLYDYLSSHPDVHVPCVKEMHYFNVKFDQRQVGFYHDRRNAVQKVRQQEKEGTANRDVNSEIEQQPGDPDSIDTLQSLVEMHESTEPNHLAYRKFTGRGLSSEAWIADITPDYCLLGPNALMSMARDFPESKFVYIMRDPVSRLWSHINMHTGYLCHLGHKISVDGLLMKVLEGGHDHIMDRSNYAGALFAQSHLPFDRVKTMFYETLFSDRSILSLCNFLNIGFKAGDYDRRVRRGFDHKMNEEQRAILRWLMAPVYRQVYAVFRNEIPLNWDMAAMDAKRPDFLDMSKIAPKIIEKAG